ncbi:MAG: hypothetical protein HZC37_21820 [Burkholderiales bacterium]|nr:hypothetical protein [Burkholderiales bacterium]
MNTRRTPPQSPKGKPATQAASKPATQAASKVEAVAPAAALAHAAVVVYAKDKDRVAEFYRRTLGLTVAEWEDRFSILTGNGVEVSVIRAPEAVVHQLTIATPPALREDTPVKASFLVASFESVREAAAATGGGLKPPEAAWSWRGAVHLDGHDPEGNVVQFRRRVG